MNILISGPDFNQYNYSIGRAFNDLGFNYKISNWPDLQGNILDRSKLLLNDVINKSSNQFEYQYQHFSEKIEKYNHNLISEINLFQPDVVLILKGDIIYPKTVEKIKKCKNIVLIMWSYDSAIRTSGVLTSGKYYDIFYTFEPTDIPILDKYNVKSKFLPMGYDPHNYFKLETDKKNIDISFIGNINNNTIRKELLEKIVLNYPELNIGFWGKSWTWYNPFLLYEYKMKMKKLGNHINNYHVTHEEINRIYNSSKLCLNIHHPQSKTGLNPRTFEILGSGGFELVDYKSSLNDLFKLGIEIECYRNEKELLDKIEYYLENEEERKKIVKRGSDIVKKKHTYTHRAKVILTDINELRG